MPGKTELPAGALLLPEAANNRHGMVFRPQIAQVAKCDIPGVIHAGVPMSVSNQWKSASGGVGRDDETAKLAAIGEGVERYCAAIADVPLRTRREIEGRTLLGVEGWSLFSPAQREQQGFPFTRLYGPDCAYTDVYSLKNNELYWAPHPLVVLRDDYETGIPTSSGLAAGVSAAQATLRAVQELIERDALMITWLHCLSARAIPVPAELAAAVSVLEGEVYAFDLTPRYSPFPVIAVAGGVPSRGKWRFSLGVACRESFEEAVQKAYLEWCQGVFFAGVYPKYVDTTALSEPGQVKSFDDHAMYYTQNPDHWRCVPMFSKRDEHHEVSTCGGALGAKEALELVVNVLDDRGVELFYRDLTTIDALQAGVRVVRALSPQLAPINSHHAWPFLGGEYENVALRYEWATPSDEPNQYPHPLG